MPTTPPRKHPKNEHSFAYTPQFIPTEQEELPKTKGDVIETRARATGEGRPVDKGVPEARPDGAEPRHDGGKVHVRKVELRTDGPKARGGRRGGHLRYQPKTKRMVANSLQTFRGRVEIGVYSGD